MVDTLSSVIFIAVLVAITFVVVAGVIAVVETVKCARLQQIMPDQEFKWQGVFGNCRVKTNAGMWIDSDNLHLIELGDNSTDD